MTSQNQTTEAPAMIRVNARHLAVQPRTLLIVKPAFIHCEPRQAVRDGEADQPENRIESGPHQIDPHRGVSRVAVMPNLELFRSTGNPYPADVEDPTVITSKSWRPYVALARAVFGILSQSAEPVTAVSIADAACKVANLGADANGNATRKALNVVLDTLRDLRCYGFAVSDVATVSVKLTRFSLSPDVANLQTLKEWEEQNGREAAEQKPAELVQEPAPAPEAEQPAKRKRTRKQVA